MYADLPSQTFTQHARTEYLRFSLLFVFPEPVCVQMSESNQPQVGVRRFLHELSHTISRNFTFRLPLNSKLDESTVVARGCSERRSLTSPDLQMDYAKYPEEIQSDG